MLTWTDIQASIGKRWQVVASQPAAISLVVTLGERKQKVFVELLPKHDRPAVQIISEIFAARHLVADEALRYNGTAERGGLAVIRGVAVLREILLLETVGDAELDAAIQSGAAEAARWAQKILKPAPSVEIQRATFGHLCE